MSKLLVALSLAACPLCAQPVPSCPAPGTLATVTFSIPGHPGATEVRIERNEDGKANDGRPHEIGKAVGLMAASSAGGTATFVTMPGQWDVYVVQEAPYWQSAAVPFVCAAGPPGPPTPTPTPTPTPVPTPSPAAACTRVTIGDTVVGVCISDIEIVLQCQATGSFSFSVIAPGKAILQIPVGPCP